MSVLNNYGSKINVSKMKDIIIKTIDYNCKIGAQDADRRKQVLCFWGRPGIGKTSVIKQMASNKPGEELDVIEVPLAQFEEMGDVHGMPEKSTSANGDKFTSYAPPEWVPKTNRRTVIVFDDWNRADVRIIKGCMQLLQNHRTVSWKLPANCCIMLTGNPDDGNNLVTSIDTAIFTRISHFELQPDHLLWSEWAHDSGEVDNRVISFVLRYKEMFCPEKVDSKTNPRTLSEFGEFLKGADNLTQEEIAMFAESKLDAETALSFVKFLNDEIKFLIDPKDILEGKWDKNMVKGLKDKGQIEIINTILSRLFLEIGSTRFSEKKRTEFISFILQDSVPKDMAAAITRRIAHNPKKNMWIQDTQLGKALIEVYS